MDCDAPATFEELREWRFQGGIPAEIHSELYATAEGFTDDLEELGCDLLPSDGAAPVSCVTTNGYRVEGEGWRDSVGGDHGFEISIVASDAATGELPTGALEYAAHLDYSEGKYGPVGQTYRLSWTFEDPATTGLGEVGSVRSSFLSSGDSCGIFYNASLEGTYQGCALDISWQEDRWVSDSTGEVEAEAWAVNEWSASVTTYACRNTVGVLLGRTAFLDDDWNEIARTDADGDHCAAEDCDCDDADPSVSPNTYDEWGDGLDLDCDGEDYSGWLCATWDYGNRCDRHEDTGAPGDSGADDSGADDSADDSASEDSAADDTAPRDTASPDSADSATPPSSDPGCTGCSTPATPGAALLLALAALFRRRR